MSVRVCRYKWISSPSILFLGPLGGGDKDKHSWSIAPFEVAVMNFNLQEPNDGRFVRVP